MAVTTSSKIFSINQVKDGTDVNDWISGLTISTFHDIDTCQLGSQSILVTVVYE